MLYIEVTDGQVVGTGCLSDIKGTVMIWMSWVQTTVGSNLGCVNTSIEVILEPKI